MRTDRRSRLRLITPLLLATGLIAGVAAAEDGDPDPSFGGGDGRVVVTWGDYDAHATAVEALPGGGLLVAGRLNSDYWAVAALDAGGVSGPTLSFDLASDGVHFPSEVFDLGRTASGQTTLAGWGWIGQATPRPALARLTAAGALDATFDGDGRKVVTALPLGWTLTTVADALVLADGRSVFVGECDNCLAGETGVYVLRLTAAGTPDGTFSGDGWIAFEVDGLFSTHATAIAAGTADSLLIGGYGPTAPNLDPPYVARLTSIGELDTSFGEGDGSVELVGHGLHVTDLALDPDTGKIVVALADAGTDLGGGALVGLTSSGEIDTAFGPSGGPITAPGAVNLDLEEGTRIDAVDFQSDGRIVAAGTINANGTQQAGFFLARTLADGTLDPSFDGNGVQRVEFDRDADAEDRLFNATLAGGRLVTVGYARATTGSDVFAILRVASAHLFSDGFERGTTGAWGTP